MFQLLLGFWIPVQRSNASHTPSQVQKEEGMNSVYVEVVVGMPQLKEVPGKIVNPNNSHVLEKRTFLGKGGYGRCYELIDTATRKVYAGKIVANVLLRRKYQKDKMASEISIQRVLSHAHIVKLYDFFEDDDNIYVLLELCHRRSLLELHKRRRTVTEPEARYFTSQVVSACEYLHCLHIIHRDLKLGNIFLNGEMQVKVGDFGLASNADGERKTLCGTPNYMAPEILNNQIHSYEVDMWAIGCILYTLLVGKPPFETLSLQITYNKIKRNDYSIPPGISAAASHLIRCLLAPIPSQRPKIQQIAKFDFFVKGFTPNRLPTSCLTIAPKFTEAQLSPSHDDDRRDFCGSKKQCSGIPRLRSKEYLPDAPSRPLATVPKLQTVSVGTKKDQSEKANDESSDVPAAHYLADLLKQLDNIFADKPTERALTQEDEAEDPAAAPVFWISRWIDYSDKYGIGYQLCDNSIGVLFNDYTKIVLHAAGEQVQYTDDNNAERYFFLSSFTPEIPELDKKIKLLKCFRKYMVKHLSKTGADRASREGDELARLPYVRTWYRTESAVVFHMSNGTFQINFKDHLKLVICPLMGAVTYIEKDGKFRTFNLDLLKARGCSKEALLRLQDARMMVKRLVGMPNLTYPIPPPITKSPANGGALSKASR